MLYKDQPVYWQTKIGRLYFLCNNKNGIAMKIVDTPRIIKPIRQMTVCCKASRGINNARPKLFPVLRLCGKWLQDSGFNIGHVVDIVCEQGRITITIANDQKYEVLQNQFQLGKIITV